MPPLQCMTFKNKNWNTYLTDDDSENMLASLHSGKQNQYHPMWTDRIPTLATKEQNISIQPSSYETHTFSKFYLVIKKTSAHIRIWEIQHPTNQEAQKTFFSTAKPNKPVCNFTFLERYWSYIVRRPNLKTGSVE